MFWVRPDLDSGKKIRVFNWGGLLWVRSDLDSGKKIRVFNLGGGVLGKVRLGLWEEFHFRGAGVLEPNSRTGVFSRIWSKISGNLAWKPSLLVHHR